MSDFKHQPLSSQTNIRILRLLPKEKNEASCLCGELVEYSIQTEDDISHPYKALSYAWESDKKVHDLIINSQTLEITASLHVALHRLQYASFERCLWVDAICINQSDTSEKETQIPMMAEIYASARSVLVWLGLGDEDSDRAISAICCLGSKHSWPEMTEIIEASITRLLERPWFQRIWIIQEVAVARHVEVLCGHTEVDGHAFSIGVSRLKNIPRGPAMAICDLIQSAIFHPRNISKRKRMSELRVHTLGDLLDQFNTQGASISHDKIYALRGLCRDHLHEAVLEPNYSLPWSTVLKQLVHLLLGDKIAVTTWDDQETAEIRSRCKIIGTVHSAAFDNTEFSTTLRTGMREWERDGGFPTVWNVKPSSNSVKQGDILCLLQDSAVVTIMRWQVDHFVAIKLAMVPEEDPDKKVRSRYGLPSWSSLVSRLDFEHDLVLTWDWQAIVHRHGVYDLGQEQRVERIQRAIQLWNDFEVLPHFVDGWEHLVSAEEQKQVQELADEVKQCLTAVMREHPSHQQDCQCSRLPLSCAVLSGESAIVKLIVDSGSHQMNRHLFGSTLLSIAAKHGHDEVVRVLLDTGKVNISNPDFDQEERTPLHWCVQGGHETVLRTLLEHDELSINETDGSGVTAFDYAVREGQTTIARLLLNTGKCLANNPEDGLRCATIALAIDRGHIDMIKLLLVTGNINMNEHIKDYYTPLTLAIKHGHIDIVKAFLDTEKIDMNRSIDRDYAPLTCAAKEGQVDMVKFLLGIEELDINMSDWSGNTPLAWAAKRGHVHIVKLFLNIGNIDVNKSESGGYTALSWAAAEGHIGIVDLLLQRKDIKAGMNSSTSPIHESAKYGKEDVLQLLLKQDQAEVDLPDGSGMTPLFLAARDGHTGIVRLLLDTGKVDINKKNKEGQTPMMLAIKLGHEAIVKLLSGYITADVGSADMEHQ